ncbi:MAG: tryptophan-rich sensory protein [Deltaproteobacteria bacterium]|nr:tryptophan-rich sensory protein [Deltaproteobacteria bacterium]
MTGLPNIALRHHAALLLGCIVASCLPGVIGAQFEPGEWYAQLEKSALTPPGWVFPIMWTALYISIGVALYIYLVHAPARGRRGALAVLAGQLVLNAAWSWLFFGRHLIGTALVEIVVLWVAILATMFAFARHSRFSAKLLVPYLVWVTFATYLNFVIWLGN